MCCAAMLVSLLINSSVDNIVTCLPPTQESRYAVRDRCIEMVLIKKNASGAFWAQLPKDKNKFKNTCKADWDRWIDDDEEVSSKQLGSMSDLMGGGGITGTVRIC
jgi:hypothetical protein